MRLIMTALTASFISAPALATEPYFPTSFELNRVEEALERSDNLRHLRVYGIIDILTATGADQISRSCGLVDVRNDEGQAFDPVMFYVAIRPDDQATVITDTFGRGDAQLKNLCRKFGLME